MYAGMPIVGFILSFCLVAAATALLVPIVRERRKSRLLAPMRGLACDAPGGIGISVLCSGVSDPEQIRNLLAVEYANYEVIAVLDAARYPEEYATLVSHYRMIRVEWTPTGELAVEGIRSVGRSRKRRFRRLVLINRAADTTAGDFDAATTVATYDYLLPVEDDVLPMHCSASMDPVTHETAVFFGLSGTGKTTLSANPTRLLIGDDEHGWSDMGIFNIEGGCYAKCEGLDAFHEPEIFNAVRFGAICENVVLDENRKPNYDDISITHNTRVAYPVEHIPNAWTKGMGTTPSVVLFLTCDAFGVLPPISRLTADAAMYHFVTGFTAKIPGTEVGVTEPTPTFSSLFGEPFMPLDPMVYAKMLGERIADGRTRVYLVNTGWIGGGYGVGHRIELAYTRSLVARALDGTIEDSEFVHDDIFNVDIPTTCHGVPDGILVPRQYWQSTARYDEAAHNLAVMFEENFEKKYSHLPESVKAAGPHAQVSAEARHHGRGLLGLRH